MSFKLNDLVIPNRFEDDYLLGRIIEIVEYPSETVYMVKALNSVPVPNDEWYYSAHNLTLVSINQITPELFALLSISDILNLTWKFRNDDCVNKECYQ